MKSFVLILIFSASLASVRSDIIAQWNFNSVPPDSSTSTGTNVPSFGNGTVSLLNGITNSFIGGSGSSDPAPNSDDSAWSTKGYPPLMESNKTAGVEFAVSTVGYSNIVVRWDHRATSTASKYFRFQYCWDGIVFIDYNTPVATQVDSTFEPQTNSLLAYPNVNNNAGFRFRIVSEFERTALGSGTNAYVTPYGTNTYGPNQGSVAFDYVTVLGTLIPGGNTPPTITSSITNQTIRVNHSTGPLDFTVLDAEDPASSLTLNAGSSDVGVIPLNNIVFGGSSSSRTVNVTATGQPGSSTITIWVIDTGGKSNSTSFVVSVLPANTAPVISTIPTTNCLINSSVLGIPLIVGDAESPASVLTLSGSSSNTALLPDANIVFAGSDSNRTVSLTPIPGQIGVAPVSIRVSDGTNTATSSFALMVTPSPDVLFLDSFSYGNGSLLTNSAFLWQNRSGPDGQCQVTNGQLQVSASLSEDVVGRLIGASYNINHGTILYSGLKLKFLTLPGSTADYFAHFANGSTLRGRIYAYVPTGSPTGTFRLQTGNGTNSVELPISLTTNVTYTVVTRYNIDAATTTLWLNPTAETDASITATDVQTPAAIASYGFRENSTFAATVLIDDLKVGLSFAAVTTTNYATVAPIALSWQRLGTNLVLTWTDPGFSLQSAPNPTGPFTNIPFVSSPYTNPFSSPTKYFRLKY